MSAEKKVIVMVDNYKPLMDSYAWLFKPGNPFENYAFIPIVSGEVSAAEIQAKVLEANPSLVITGVRNECDTDDMDRSGLIMAQALIAQGLPVIINSASNYSQEAGEIGATFFYKRRGVKEWIDTVLSILES